jgi:hypothetical protein
MYVPLHYNLYPTLEELVLVEVLNRHLQKLEFEVGIESGEGIAALNFVAYFVAYFDAYLVAFFCSLFVWWRKNF